MHINVDGQASPPYLPAPFAEPDYPMPPPTAPAGADLEMTVACLEAEVEASLAIAQATLLALAALSPALARQAESALIVEGQREESSEVVAARLRACREQMTSDDHKARHAGDLERVLIKAADAVVLPAEPRAA